MYYYLSKLYVEFQFDWFCGYSAIVQKRAWIWWGAQLGGVRSSVVDYLSKRLRRQGQTEGALTNTKVLLVSILKNATVF